MKKLLSTLAVATAMMATASAQTTMSYDAQVVGGTYTEITDGTVIPLGEPANGINAVVYDKANTPNTEAFTGEGYPIGFDFKFDNQLMNQFLIGAHGYLVLGKDSVSATCQTNFYSLFGGDEDKEIIGLVYRSIVANIPTTEISYKTTGATPDRQLIVQYKDLQLCADGWDGTEIRDTVSLQIRLHESGKIEIVTKGYEPSSTVAENMNYNDGFKVGIRGVGDDMLTKTNDFMDENFNAKGDILLWRATSFPSDGTTYTFLPPEDCAAPTAQPTGLVLSASTQAVAGEFTATDAADHYLVTVDQSETVTALPEDGTFYAKGDSIGNAIVIGYTTGTTFESEDILTAATKYYVHVFATNSYCFYAPKYNKVSPLTVAISTRPAAPTSLEVTASDTTRLALAISANEAGDDVLIAQTIVPKKNDYDQILPGGTFGVPAGDYAVGDSIDGGGVVVFVGKAADAKELTGLLPGTVYHLCAWSRDAAGEYSSTDIACSAVTAGVVTWKPDFVSVNDDNAPVGWTYNDNLRVTTNTATDVTSVYTQVNKADGVNGKVVWFETSDIYLAEGENRLVTDMLITEFLYRRWSPYTMRDKDTIDVQVTTDGKEYKTVMRYDKDNQLTFNSSSEYMRLYIPFTEAAGKKARLRIWMHIYGAPKLDITNMRVEEKKACDYPIDLLAPDSCVVGSEATVTWTPQGEEDAWEVRYKKSADAEWGETITARDKKATLTGLDAVTEYDVQVRARCSATEQSEWSETCTFTSGLTVPFSFIFAEQESLPSSWQSMTGALATPTELAEGGNWEFSSSWFGASLRYAPYGTAADDWFLTPVIDLGEENVNCLVDLGLTMSYFDKETSDGVIKLVVAADGKTFNESDVVLTINSGDMPEAYESKMYTASLKGYHGNVRLGMYVHSTTGEAPEFTVDTLNVRFSCVNDIVAVVDSIGEDTAHVSWTSGADEWLVFYREKGETQRNYVKVDKPELGIDGLKPFTNYEVGLTKACEEGDTAKVAIVEFMTTGTLCAAPTDVVAVPSKYSMTISWTGEASAYNVRYRQKSEEPKEWTVKQVREPQIVITELTDNTEYEYAVQSQCGTAANDTSAYTPTYSCTTLVETCITPKDIVVTPSYNKATVTWTGEADTYELAYRKADVDEWTSTVVPNGGYTIEGLTAETAYKLRMRSICTEGDSSLWSNVVDFATIAEPECVTPSDLAVSELTENSALLTWKADASNIAWNLRYRESSVAAWTTLEALTESTHRLNDLKANTAYIWRVQAVCEEERTSSWATQSKFTTSVETGIDNVGIDDLKVFVTGGILNIVNPVGGLIKTVTVYGMDGKVIAHGDVNTCDNAFIHLTTHGNVVIKVKGQKQTKTFKAYVK